MFARRMLRLTLSIGQIGESVDMVNEKAIQIIHGLDADED
jgi:hypothetical protein